MTDAPSARPPVFRPVFGPRALPRLAPRPTVPTLRQASEGGPAAASAPGHRPSRRPERFFVPSDRFRPSELVDASRGSPSLPERLEAVRPLDFMSTFRCDPSPSDAGRVRVLTAQDHAVLEVLLSGQREDDPGMRQRFATVPVAAIRNVLGASLSDLSLRNSLRRLSETECVLPGVHSPKSRMTFRRREAIAAAEQDPDDDRLRSRAYSAADIERKAFTVEPETGTVHELSLIKLRGSYGPPSPTPMLRLFSLPPEREEDWWSGSRHKLRRFVPLVRWLVADGLLHFEIATWLRVWTDSARTEPGHVRVPYGLVDLRQIAGFSSPYAAPLYRQLLAGTFDAETRTARVGNVVVRIPMADLPDAVGYRVQRLGLAAQLKTKVLAPTDRDFAEMTGRISISSSRIDGTDVCWTVHVPVDVGRMRAATKWRMPDGRLVKIREGNGRDDLRPLKAKEERRFRVRPSAYKKVLGRLKLEKEDILRFGRAWHLALDEALRHDDPRYDDLTGRGHLRLYRGSRLLMTIAAKRAPHGVEDAFYLFAEEEARDPDLTRPEVLDVLELDGTEACAALDRKARWIQEEKRRSGDPETTERPDGRLPVDPAVLDQRRREREQDAWMADMDRRQLAAERSELLEDLAVARGLRPAPEASADPEPTQAVWTKKRFAPRPVAPTAEGFVPDPEVRVDDVEGRLHVVRSGVRSAEAVDLRWLREELEALGYERPTFGDATAEAGSLFGEHVVFEVIPPVDGEWSAF